MIVGWLSVELCLSRAQGNDYARVPQDTTWKSDTSFVSQPGHFFTRCGTMQWLKTRGRSCSHPQGLDQKGGRHDQRESNLAQGFLRFRFPIVPLQALKNPCHTYASLAPRCLGVSAMLRRLAGPDAARAQVDTSRFFSRVG